MTINPKAQLQGLEVICFEECRVVHMGPNALNLSTGALKLSGNILDVMFVKVIANQVLASVLEGNLHIYSLILTNPSLQNTFSTGEGDIVIQSINSMNIIWSQPSINICFFAPKITSVGLANPTCQATINNVNSSGCNNGYLLCKQSDLCNSALAAPTLSLSSTIGNIYVNIIDSDGVPVNQNVNNVKGINYTKGLYFDEDLNKTINNYLTEVGSTAHADPLFTIKLNNAQTFSSSGITFLVVANSAYLNAYPWWIAFVSANLLLGNMYVLSGNLAPGFCPFNTLPTTGNLADTRTLLVSRFSSLGSKTDAAFIYGSSYPAITELNQNNLGFRGSEGDFNLYGIQLNGLIYYLEEYGLEKSTSLLLAVVISVILGVIIGFICMILLLVALDKLLEYYTSKSNHISKYAGRVKKTGEKIETNAKIDQVADENMEGHVDERKGLKSLISVLNRLPPQFMIVDLIVREIRLSIASSANAFFNTLFIELKWDDVDDFEPLPFKDIKEVYEQYCFLKQYAEEDLMEAVNLSRIEDRGFTFEKKGEEVVSLVNLKWLNKDEEFEVKRNALHITENTTSLEIFMHDKCSKTPFSQDVIDFEEFRISYEAFCDEKRLAPIVITRAMMNDCFSIDSESSVPVYLRRSQNRTKNGKRYKANLDTIRKKNIAALGTGGNTKDDKYPMTEKEDDQHGLLSFLLDFLAVLLHLIWLGALGGVLIILPLFIELEISEYNIGDYRYSLKYEDLTLAPWNLQYKFQYLSGLSIAFFVFAGCYFFFGLIDLVIYYSYLQFPTATLKSLRNLHSGSLSKFFQTASWVYIWLVLSFVSMYATLVGVWSILGAILNPNAYLAYGAAVVTFVTFIFKKIQEFHETLFKGTEALQELLFSRLQGIYNDIMKKVLTNVGFSADPNMANGNIKDSLVEHAENALKATILGKAILAVGLEPKVIVAGLSGDDEALITIGEKQGVPKNIMKLVLAMVSGKKAELVKCIQDLAKNPEIQIDPEIVQLAIDIVLNTSEMNIPVLIGRTSKIFFEYLFQQVAKNADEGGLAYLDICKQVIPRMFTAFKHFRIEEMDYFLDEFQSINEFLINSVKKTVLSIKFEKSKGNPGKYFNKDDEPNFALQPHIFQGLRVFNVLSSGEGKADKVTTDRLIKAIYYLLQNMVGLNRQIIEMLHIMMCTSPERLTSIEPGKGLIPIDEQENILDKSCKILGIPSILIRISWKIYTGNYTFDDNFIKEIEQFFVKGDNKIPPEVLKMAMQFFCTASARLSSMTLYQSTSKFKIEEDMASIVYMFGKNKLTQRQCNALKGNAIFEAICNKLHISSGQTLGIISLFKGDYANDYVIELFDSLTKRWGFEMIKPKIIVSILTIFLSKDENELILATKNLNLNPYELLFVGKRILHPANLSDTLLSSLGIPLNDCNIKYRQYLQIENKVALDDWVKSVLILLSSSFRSEKNNIPEDSSEQNLEVRDTRRGSSFALNDANKGHVMLKARKITLAKHNTIKPSEAKRNNIGFTEEEQDKRTIASLLVGIKTLKLNGGTIKSIISRLAINIDDKTLESACDVIAEILQTLKVMNSVPNMSRIKVALENFSKLLQIDNTLLTSVVNIICLHDKAEVSSGLSHMVKDVLSKHELESIQELSAFLQDKTCVLDNIRNYIYALAQKTKIPYFIIKLMLCPLIGEEPPQIQMEESLVLLDQVGIHPTAMKQNGITFAPKNADNLSLEDFRMLFSGIIIGNNAMLRILFEKLGYPLITQDIICALTEGNFRKVLPQVCRAIIPVFTKLDIPEDVAYIALEIVKSKRLIF